MAAVVAVPSHRIQSMFGGALGGPSFASMLPAGTSSSHSQASSSFNALPNVSYSRGRGAASLSVLAARTASASASTSSSSAHIAPSSVPPTPVMTRPRRSSIRCIPLSSVLALPPPPRTSVASSSSEDNDNDSISSLMRRGPTPMVTYTYSSSYSYRQPQPPVDNQRAAKLVANVLLSRAAGKPMRRRQQCYGGNKAYVKSCLSNVVEVEC